MTSNGIMSIRTSYIISFWYINCFWLQNNIKIVKAFRASSTKQASSENVEC